ncbi:uncharacterized protein LOC133038457 [Cannabis sativa]|uniref:uncharacterized protein LOC133038457 n=1 Tax=Cannabis sativa TaxID=3483 RepID=UPI0029CA0CF2|nr:uncharacterized protein LOC133038457 [Cannabis sativa]
MRMKDLELELQTLQSKEAHEADLLAEATVLNSLGELWKRKESMWKQRSREIWLAKGDRNSSFFHASTVVRRKRNHILNLKDPSGTIVSNEKDIGVILNDYFKDLFASKGSSSFEGLDSLIPNSITHDENLKLTAIHEMEEIKDTVFQMHPLKAPGPDGLSGCFFKRLRNVLQRIIAPFQSAFLPGRWIAESSLLTQEIVNVIKKKKGKGGLMALKMDMNKAYDRLEWSFLKEVLMRFGFNSHVFVKIIMSCVSTVSYSILLNGRPLKKFQPGRGIRQGDPLSPYLFLLCNEIFSRLLSFEQEKGLFHGIRIARNVPEISHLMFADDTIIFSRANLNEVEVLNSCIKKFEDWSGQKCSKQKSGVLISSNCSRSLRGSIEKILNIGAIRDDEKHLGNPFLFSRSKRKDFNFLKTKLHDKLEGWRLKTLSKMGRAVYVNSVALALPSYTMSTFQLPTSSCREFDAIVKRFWWNGSPERKKYWAATSWSSLCQPKQRGGLGFRRFEDINHALLTKLAWQLASKMDKPWCYIFKGRYFPRETFWSISEKNSDSFVCRGILNARKTIAKGACTVITSGEDIDIWWQPWIPWLGYEQFRDLMESMRSKAPSLRCVADLMYRRSRCWNIGYLRFLFGVDLGDRIAGIQIVKSDEADMLIWKDSTSGDKFSSRNLCPVCLLAPDSPIHLFAQCSFASAIWFSGPLPQSVDAVRQEVGRRFLELDPDVDHVVQPAPLNFNSLQLPRLSTKHYLLVDGSFIEGSYGCAMVSLSSSSSEWWTSVSSGSCNSALEAEMLASTRRDNGVWQVVKGEGLPPVNPKLFWF